MRYRRLTSIPIQFQLVLCIPQTPLRSMKLQTLYIWWQERFHRIPCNCSCLRNWHTPSSMEFHRIPWNCSCQRNWRTWSSMEFHGIPWNCLGHRNSTELLLSAKLVHHKLYGIPWNWSCYRNWRTPSSMEFHRIPWNCSSQRNWCTTSYMEFHGTARVIEIGTLQVPWNSMEFHGTASVSEIGTPQVPCHGIPWNCSCKQNWRTPSSMDFHGTFFCYLMDPLVSSILWVLNLDRIPWNLSFQILVKII